MKLKGKALGAVAEAVEKEREAAELAKETARVKHVVEDILGGLKVFDQRITETKKRLEEFEKGRRMLQHQLDQIKAGNEAACKHPENMPGPDYVMSLERFGPPHPAWPIRRYPNW